MYETGKMVEEFISIREKILIELKESGLIIKLLWKNPNNIVINSINSEPFFQLFFKDEIMFLLIKFKEINWVDIPCAFPEDTKNLFTSDFLNMPVNIILANSNTGKICANVEYKMPSGITKAFIQNIHIQKSIPKKILVQKINKIHSSFSASDMSVLSLGKTK